MVLTACINGVGSLYFRLQFAKVQIRSVLQMINLELFKNDQENTPKQSKFAVLQHLIRSKRRLIYCFEFQLSVLKLLIGDTRRLIMYLSAEMYQLKRL